MATTENIYLLSPHNSNENEVKIIWADSMEEARQHADMTAMQRVTANTIPPLEDGIYSHETTSCEEISSDITDFHNHDSTIHFKYNGVEISLVKDHAEYLSRFIK